MPTGSDTDSNGSTSDAATTSGQGSTSTTSTTAGTTEAETTGTETTATGKADESSTGEMVEPGETVWSVESDEDIEAIAVTEEGDILFAFYDELRIEVRRLDGVTGQEVEAWSLEPPAVPPGGSSLETDTIDLAAVGSDPIVAYLYIVLDDAGDFLDVVNQVERIGTTDWTVELPGTVFDVDAMEGVFVLSGQALIALDPDGTERWQDPTANSDYLVATSSGGVIGVGRSHASAWDANGEVSWEYDAPDDGKQNRFLSASLYGDGGVLLNRTVDLKTSGVPGTLTELDADGEAVRTVEGEFGSFYMATDSDRNIFHPAAVRSGNELAIAKYGPRLEEIWRWHHESASTARLDDLVADREGALLVLTDDRIFKVAP